MSRCPSRLRRETLIRQAHRCAICGFPKSFFKEEFDIHRILPNREGGTYVKSNVIACCSSCHLKAEGLTLEELQLFEPYYLP